MKTSEALEFAECVVDEIFNDSREFRATLSLLGPLPAQGPAKVINLVEHGQQVDGLLIPRTLFPVVLQVIKRLIGVDPDISGVLHQRKPLLKYFESFGGDCKFEVSVMMTNQSDKREIVQIHRRI